MNSKNISEAVSAILVIFFLMLFYSNVHSTDKDPIDIEFTNIVDEDFHDVQPDSMILFFDDFDSDYGQYTVAPDPSEFVISGGVGTLTQIYSGTSTDCGFNGLRW